MAPVKPMGVKGNDRPETKPGVTGFYQEYNQDPGPRQDLNPAAVTDPDSLPKPLASPNIKPAKPAKASKAKK